MSGDTARGFDFSQRTDGRSDGRDGFEVIAAKELRDGLAVDGLADPLKGGGDRLGFLLSRRVRQVLRPRPALEGR